MQTAKSRQGKAAGKGRYNVRALERALRILHLLSDGRSWRLSDISEALNMSSSTAFRLLSTLASYGYIERDTQTGGYSLGLACLELARAYYEASDIRRHARPVLEALRDSTTETVHLAILDNWEVFYLEKLQGLHAIGLMSSAIGGRFPAYCTGLGKVLLAYHDPQEVRAHYAKDGLKRFTDTTITDADELVAHLQQVRAQGYALDLGEHEAEVHCVAVPISDIEGHVVAAISVSGPAGRVDAQDQAFIDAIKQAARAISHTLGHMHQG